jgi:hypothetical protein
LLGLHVFGAMAKCTRSMRDIETRSRIAHDQLQSKIFAYAVARKKRAK